MPSSPQGSASILRHPEISASVNEKNMQAFEKVYSIVADTISGIEDSVVWGNIDQERVSRTPKHRWQCWTNSGPESGYKATPLQ